MSSIRSDVYLISLLSTISSQLNRYLALVIFLFGIIGNLLNIIVFSQRTLRSNPCSYLFLLASICYLLSLCSGIFPRFLSTWDADLGNTNEILCKLRIYIYFNSLTIAFWLIALATIDRWFLSSQDVSRRNRSSLKNVKRSFVCLLILSSLFESQQIFCYEANLTNTPLKCYSKTVGCAILSDVSFAFVTVLIPVTLMLIFGLLILSNIRRSQIRLNPITSYSNEGINQIYVHNGRVNPQRRTDRHLLSMLLAQIILILLFSFPFAFSKFYSTITRYLPKSSLQSTTESFIFNLFLLFINVASGMPFYIYTLTGGHVFRKTLANLFRK
ncbi:unnamed protein product [Adineta ricciae]|uniref:G-protein coupled receptors family 1 profile domain-containing protein n=1 Tax=Adineta ricciae TaxID=249248 RepID=A0A814TBT1_ADIRI|nr:unnamed protein product [Adineta ricciae]CAF1591112.1 unnamed protein product [Adineta ricciae]